MSHYYTVVIIFSIFIMAILVMLAIHNDLLEAKQKKKLFIIAALVSISAASEWLGVWMNGMPLWTRPLHIAVKVIELSSAPLISFLCADFLKRIRHRKLVGGFLIFHTVLEILSGIFGFIFYVDRNNVYHHSSFYWIYIVSYLLGVGIFIWVVLRLSERYHGVSRVVFLSLPVFLLSGVVIQYINNNIRIDWLCISISILLLYVSYSELIQQYDALTNLFNRRCFESKLAQIHTSAIILFFDIDEFKIINDTYGHATGDFYLAAIGETLQKVYAKRGRCYRIGGDEFCVILPADKACENPPTLWEPVEQILNEQRKTDKLVPSVSIGYAFFDPVYNRISDAIHSADMMMYEQKKLRKNEP